MLSGGDPFDVDVGPNPLEDLPSAWDVEGLLSGFDPRDYIVADNIRYLAHAQTVCADTEEELVDQLELLGIPLLDYDDDIFRVDNRICVRPVTDAYAIFQGAIPSYGPNWAATIEAANAPRPFFTYWDMGQIRNLGTTTADDKVVPIAFQFWSDIRNTTPDQLDNDGDGFIDEIDENAFGTNVGSPLDARLPLAVTVDFTLFFRSPYLGAPDFNQRFTQRIDLPTGHRRQIKTTAPGP
jgi:hypothetical protein